MRVYNNTLFICVQLQNASFVLIKNVFAMFFSEIDWSDRQTDRQTFVHYNKDVHILHHFTDNNNILHRSQHRPSSIMFMQCCASIL